MVVGALLSVSVPGALAAARPGAAAAAPTPPKGKPKFDATFRGLHLDKKIWDTCYPKMPSYNGGCKNWGNPEEQEWYEPSQVKVADGQVALVAKRERTVGATETGARKVYECRSGMITSYPSLKFQYGFVQVVASIPHAKGLWTALWLAAASGKYPPEIDMVESWGKNILTGSFYHPDTGRRSRATYSPNLTKGWQTYSLEWTPKRLIFWVGDTVVLTVNGNVPKQPMYFLADVAEYLPATPGRCSGQMLIKSVKVWTT
jgi:beta-glucanase (GH16 family)